MVTALCQACLRVRTVPTAEDYACVCGGSFCDCPLCMELLARLLAGERGHVPGLLTPIVAWSPKTGCVNPL